MLEKKFLKYLAYIPGAIKFNEQSFQCCVVASKLAEKYRSERHQAVVDKRLDISFFCQIHIRFFRTKL